MGLRPGFDLLRRRLVVALLSLALLSSYAFGQSKSETQSTTTLSSAERETSVRVKVETIKEVTNALAADDMQGRGTMQPGGDKAAGYISDRFAKLGLKALGNKNSYLQPIKFKDQDFSPETTFKLEDETLKMTTDYAVSPPYSGDENASGELVFIAYGMMTSSPSRNDLAGIDIKNKIVVMLDGPPKNIAKEAWKKADMWVNILVTLTKQGAAGVVYVSHGREEHPNSEMMDYYSRRSVSLGDESDWPSELPPHITVSNQTAEKMFANSGVSYTQALTMAESNDFKPFKLKKSAKIVVRFKNSKGTSNNVVGLLEGSDPKLKEEAIVFSAHYDAFGVGAGNKIYHGAADNAIGVAEMIAIAEALVGSALRPRRSIIFLAVTGEEYGLYGSKYWAANPTWKIKKVAADLNFDGMGTEVYGPVKVIVGFGAEHSSLGALLNEVAAAVDIKVIPDPTPDENSFYRSDHYSFVTKGVPALMLLGAPEGDPAKWVARMKAWEKTDYHQPGDVVQSDWNWEGPHTMAVLGVIMGLRLSNSEEMPAWLPSSPFNRERGTNAEPPPEP